MEILHICKHITRAERALNASVDELLNAMGITREELQDGKLFQKTNPKL